MVVSFHRDLTYLAPKSVSDDGKVPNVSVKPESSPTDSKTTEFEAVKLKVTGSAPKAPAATEDDQKQTEENIFTTKGLKKVADSPVQKELEAIAAAEAKPDSGKSSGLAMA